ncbi:3-hydroxyacyl-CoA dehydrogenase NAD-binding domain-containing protein [Pseudooceanicola aestuarii]|uniref:3-hydroxyacyl-CoA dehydrogenase NAD-binding domain-containing protein n=1 Tax=Pseudooceanicola aestuarii TaxID=2697319 RepID=UPI0013D4C1FF|nr:3-hydroxyacyl-CoA dehydrogenase NAD-binding domain-containing protein [Pseudooceanicola aestuarii]
MSVLDEITPDTMTTAPVLPDLHHWRMAESDGLIHLWLDQRDRGTNVISRAVLEELSHLVAHARTRGPRALVLRSAKPGGFAAGADIDAFGAMRGPQAQEILEQGHAVLDDLAALPCTTIAVTHGAALGAGFELALACDHRIAVEGASFGFPEIRLGLHPGLGGTFRLTTLIDPVEAMTLMLTGKTAHTDKARKLGIVDAVVPERHVDAAVTAAAAGRLDSESPGWTSAAMRTRAARSLAATRMRAASDRQMPRAHYPAPYALIDLWEDHGGDRAAMQQAEIASFAALLDSATAQNLIRVFHLRQRLKSAGKGVADHISHVHVIGAGAMGAEIAAWTALQGKSVTLEDIALDPLGAAMRRAARICEGAHATGIETRDTLDRLMPDPDGLGRARANLIIEAVPEKPTLKRKLYAELGQQMRPDAILASNTSSLRLAKLVEDAPAPDRFAGLHFFNPVSKMQLVEVVSHPAAGAETLDRLAAFCTGVDRLPARVADHPGFVVNRVLTPYLLEAMMLLDEGHKREEIDRAMLDFGMPMGPLALADQVGLDICLHVADSLAASLDRPIAEVPDWLREMVEAGETGKKAGRGLYDWSDGTPHPPESGSDDAPPQDMLDRLVLPMCNAGVELLRCDVAQDADMIDAAMIFATGWAPFRGGPMHYAATLGRDVAHDRLTRLEAAHGPRFAPDAGWQHARP